MPPVESLPWFQGSVEMHEVLDHSWAWASLSHSGLAQVVGCFEGAFDQGMERPSRKGY